MVDKTDSLIPFVNGFDQINKITDQIILEFSAAKQMFL